MGNGDICTGRPRKPRNECSHGTRSTGAYVISKRSSHFRSFRSSWPRRLPDAVSCLPVSSVSAAETCSSLVGVCKDTAHRPALRNCILYRPTYSPKSYFVMHSHVWPLVRRTWPECLLVLNAKRACIVYFLCLCPFVGEKAYIQSVCAVCDRPARYWHKWLTQSVALMFSPHFRSTLRIIYICGWLFWHIHGVIRCGYL